MDAVLRRIFDEWNSVHQSRMINGIKAFETTIEELESTLFIIVAFDFRLNTQPKILFNHCPAEEAQLRNLLEEVDDRISQVAVNIQK